MSSKRLRASLCLAALCIAAPLTAGETGAGLRPYTARYQVSYRGLNGGDIEFTLKRNNGQYEFSSHLFPSFLGGLFASDQAEDTSVFEIAGGVLRPLQFRSDDGSDKTAKDIRQDFDWNKARVSGRAKDKDFELELPKGAQDRLSVQLAASLALQAGREPGMLSLVEGDSLKDYSITRQGEEHVRTPAGEYDAVILKSERSGSSRVTRYWYAEQLGFIPARAERSSDGKVDIVMELKSFQFQ